MMLTSTLLVFILIPWIRGQQCLVSYSKSETKLQGHMIKNASTEEIHQCTDKCSIIDNCHSVNFYPDEKNCELNHANHFSNPESMVESPGSAYMNYFPHPVSKCSSSLCKKPAEKCMIDSDGLNYKCEIPAVQEILMFPGTSIQDKVVFGVKSSMTATSISFWFQLASSSKGLTPSLFSHAAKDNGATSANDFNSFIENEAITGVINNVYFYVSDPKPLNYSQWYHMGLTWRSSDGQTKVYINGQNYYNGTHAASFTINPGSMVLGQDQDSYLGSYVINDAMCGNLTNLNMWDRVLSEQEVSALATSCKAGEGNIIKWSDFKGKAEGAVKTLNVTDCV